MADNQSQAPTSSLLPSDSASASGKKKSRPGKKERADRRSAVNSQPGSNASTFKSSVFASGGDIPKPQPGKYPVVFPTGAGEPARDLNFNIDQDVLARTLCEYPQRFTYNAKYAEFKAHAELEDSDFSRELVRAGLLRLSQQLVHSHVNMDLPQGDFAPINSSEVLVPSSVSAFLQQYGEHSVPALGTRFLFTDYASTVKSVVRAAEQVSSGGTDPLVRMWLPTKEKDPRTRAILAGRLNIVLSLVDVQIDAVSLEETILSGSPPDVWEHLKPLFGETDARKNRFDFLFKACGTEAVFATTYSSVENNRVLQELGILWPSPASGQLGWNLNVKSVFTDLADKWARQSATWAQFFELSSGVANRAVASGSQAQMAEVKTVDSVTVVKTHLALSAPEFSLVSCFPATGEYRGGISRRVVVTTPLSVVQRATEFVQMDWR